MSGDFSLGGKEIAVKVRGSSHYRKRIYFKVGMLTVLRNVKGSWAKVESKNV